MADRSEVAGEGYCRELDPAGMNAVNSISDCLHFSNVFTLAGYETINDKLLLEMNEKIRREKEKAAQKQSETKPDNAKESVQARLQNLARINRSPPSTRFSAAHHREFEHSAPITESPLSKRHTSGEESPAKRRRAAGGAAVGIMNSPTKPLQHLNLDNKDRLEQVSAARQREKQRRELQTSPRRRLPGRNALAGQQKPQQRSQQPIRAAGSALPALPFKLDLPLPRPTNLQSSSSKPTRPTSSQSTSSQPTSVRPTSVRPTSSQLTSSQPTSSQPTSVRPTSVRPTSSQLTSSQPTSVRATSSQSTSSQLTSSQLTSVRPTRPTNSRPTSSHSTSSPTRTSAKPFAFDLNRSSPRAVSNPTPRTLPRALPKLGASIPRSQSVKSVPRSVSLKNVVPSPQSAALTKPAATKPAPTTTFENLPSYARPTQATLRRSQSTQHSLNQSSTGTATSKPRAVSGHTK